MEDKNIINNHIKNIFLNSYKKRNEKPFEKKEKDKKRVETENWSFSNEHYSYENQLKMIKDIHINNYDTNNNDTNNNISKIALQQINRKIYGYKQQDILKKKFKEENFLTLKSVIDKMVECELKCYYCKCEMNVLYDISREMHQWTVDRIDNSLGHNLDNYYLACLDCNLKRRTRSDEKFLFTKQLKIVKTDTEKN